MRGKGMRGKILTLFVIIVGVASTLACQSVEDVAPAVTRAGIRAVRVGMTEAEVIQILGEPIARTRNAELGVNTLEYARPVRRARWYPMLWVHLEAGRVSEVYAKRYIWWGSDDYGVYSLSSTGQSERPDFETTFPR
jgi:hypothetical protein